MKHHTTVVKGFPMPFVTPVMNNQNYRRYGKSAIFLLLLAVMLSPLLLTAQQKKVLVKGLIENEAGEALQNVSVELSFTGSPVKRSVITNESGIFSFENPGVARPYKLLISHVGYITQTIERESVNVDKEETLHVILKAASGSLDGVVVIGYGKQKRSVIAGAVAEVPLHAASNRSVNSVSELFQGKTPGVVVTNEGGDPTSNPRVNIRGLGGINGEQPLYVVDGAITNAPVLSPGDIESVSVLKDAAAAIYGARASGGVIVITTKKGRSDRAVINLDAKYGVQSPWRKLEALNAKEYADVMNLAADNGQKPRLPAFDASIYPDGQITRANWVDEVFTTGKINEYNASIDGRSDKSSYYLSFGYRKAEGILLNTYNERYNFMINTEHRLRSWLRIGQKLNYRVTESRGANTSSAFEGAILSAIFYPPSIYPYTETGGFSGLPAQYAGAYGDVINPVAYLKRLDNANPASNLFVNVYLEADILKGLSFRSAYTVNKQANQNKDFRSKILEIGKIFDYNQLSMSSGNGTGVLSEQTLTYDRRAGNHHINILGGYTYQHNESEAFSVYARGFDDERREYRYFTNSTQFFQPTGNKVETAIISYLGRINYDYNEKYLLSLIGRRDGSSLVAKQNRFQNYGSVLGGWVLNKEKFFPQTDWIDQFKIRGSYGVLGNLGSLPTNAVTVPLMAVVAYIGAPPVEIPGYAESAISNPSLTWAESRQRNLGADINLFNNRLSFTVDYFVKTTSNMIIARQPPSTSGVPNSTWVNGGKAEDRGFEFGFNYNSVANKEFQYSFGGALTKLNNKLLSLNEGVETIPTNDYNIRGAVAPLLIKTGSPLYSYYVVQTDGLFKSQAEVDSYRNKDGQLIQPNAHPGDLRFVDANGDGKIDNNDRVVVGSAYPDFSYGFTFNASYKNFDLNVFFQGVYNNMLFNGLKFMGLQASVSGQNYNMLKEIRNAWSPENVNSTIPRVSQSDENNNFRTTSDWFIEKGSYMRLKNLTLGYTFPSRLTDRAGIAAVRLYVTANNLFTFTGYSGFDPEVGMDDYGIDNGRYPQARAIFGGLNITF